MPRKVQTGDKIHSTIRYSPQAKRLVEKLSDHLAISQTAVIELAIRQMAKREKIEAQEGQNFFSDDEGQISHGKS